MDAQFAKLDLEAVRKFLEGIGCEIRIREHDWVECLILRGSAESWVGRGPDADEALRAALVQAFPTTVSAVAFERLIGSGLYSIRRSSIPAPEFLVAARTPRATGAPPPLDTSDRFTNVSRSLVVLDILRERIADSKEELGLCTAARQRLAIMAWICEARAHAERWTEDERIREKVSVISRALTDIGKSFWPGSVSALQLQITPSELPRSLLRGNATSWASAADLAEQALRDREIEDERQGRDAYGWADNAATHPGPEDAEGRLWRLVTEIEAFSGTLSRQAPAEASKPVPDEDRFARWVRIARWLRTGDVQPDPWAKVAGRLRWWASRKDKRASVGARELHPGHLPDGQWSSLLDQSEVAHVSSIKGEEGEAPMLESARRQTEGKRSVIVSHRREPGLQAMLEEMLSFASLELRIAEPRRLQQLGIAIESGAYDLVLGATGFQAQHVDTALAEACRRANVPYVRVALGAPAVCLRALARARV